MWFGFQLYSADNFFYLNQSACYQVDGIDDVQEYNDTRVQSSKWQLIVMQLTVLFFSLILFIQNAMNVIGMSQTEIDSVFQMVAAVLHIGNITFYEDNKANAVIGDQQVLEIAANMLGVGCFHRCFSSWHEMTN